MSSMKYPYRDLGVPFDRNFRNDLNANFDDIEHDIRMIGGEAAQQALEAAEEANTQAIYAQTSGDYANDKGDYAAQQGDYAKTQGDYAKAQGDAANLAATNANDAANNANSAATNANNAATAANNAATNANTAADNANNATTNANIAADNANTQATNAQNAAQSANEAATNANDAADNANTQATYAQQQGDYAKEQGDYAKQVGDENKTRWLTAVNTYADIATTYPNPQLGDTVQTIDDSKIYRWDGTQWVWTQQYNANAITDVQNKIGILFNRADLVSVKEFGAKGDGATDDTLAIQNAINSLTNVNGGILFFPKGTYLISSPLKFDHRGIIFRGTGRGSILKASTSLNGGIFESIESERTVNSYLENVIFENLHFDLNSNDNAFGFRINGFTRGCLIRDNYFSNVKKAAIALSGSWSFSIERNNVQGTADKTAIGILFGDENAVPSYAGSFSVNQARIVGNTIRSCFRAIYLLYGNINLIDGNTLELNNIDIEMLGATSTVISNNYLENATSRSIYLSGTTNYAINTKIIANFLNASDSAVSEIYINNAQNCRILGNRFVKSNTHIYFGTGSSPRINNNYFEVDDKARIGNLNEYDLTKNIIYYYNLNQFEGITAQTMTLLRELIIDYTAPRMTMKTGDTGASGSTAEWRINTTSVSQWGRVGKLTSSSNEFVFTGNGVTAFSFYKLVKAYDDIELTTSGKGLILRSPDDTKRYRISVDNSGNLITTQV